MAKSQTITWKTITVEAVAIVVSILMAFAIDAWWAEKKENDVEHVALLALRSDFMAALFTGGGAVWTTSMFFKALMVQPWQTCGRT